MDFTTTAPTPARSARCTPPSSIRCSAAAAISGFFSVSVPTRVVRSAGMSGSAISDGVGDLLARLDGLANLLRRRVLRDELNRVDDRDRADEGPERVEDRRRQRVEADDRLVRRDRP